MSEAEKRVPFVQKGEWGWVSPSEAPHHLAGVRQWRADAIAAGWAHEPTYGDGESEDRAMRLLGPDGWTAQTLAREEPAPKSSCAQISLWGPDGLHVPTPPVFNMDELWRLTRVCQRCKAQDVDTQRVGFAGRVCGSCVADARREVETPGWCA